MFCNLLSAICIHLMYQCLPSILSRHNSISIYTILAFSVQFFAIAYEQFDWEIYEVLLGQTTDASSLRNLPGANLQMLMFGNLLAKKRSSKAGLWWSELLFRVFEWVIAPSFAIQRNRQSVFSYYSKGGWLVIRLMGSSGLRLVRKLSFETVNQRIFNEKCYVWRLNLNKNLDEQVSGLYLWRKRNSR